MEPIETLSRRLKKLRVGKGLTLQEAAQKISVPVSTYKEWEYGRAIQGEPYLKMAEAFGVTLRELLTGQRPDGTYGSVNDKITRARALLREAEQELQSLF